VLQGDLTSTLKNLGQAKALAPRNVAVLLERGRSEVEAGNLATVKSSVSKVQELLIGKVGAQAHLERAASFILELDLFLLEGKIEEASQKRKEALRELQGVSPSRGNSPGPEFYLRFSALLREQDAFPRAEEFLVRAGTLAQWLGGKQHPLLVSLAREQDLLEKSRQKAATADSSTQKTLEQIRRAMEAKEMTQVLSLAQLARTQLPTPQRLRAPLLGWLRYYQFKALYLSKQLDRAYNLLLSRETSEFALSARNLAYMNSVGIELATRLSRPAKELVRWGDGCVEAREAAGDREGALTCVRNVANMLELRDEESRATPFAEHLIRLGLEGRSPDVILEGFELLCVGAFRSAEQGKLPGLIPRLDGVLARFPLSPEQIKRRSKLLQVMTGKYHLVSHEKELKAFLDSK
jgi:hypothetical protein